jgi:Ca2+-binding EF-hand superfamily protein
MKTMHITGGLAGFALLAGGSLQAAVEMDSFQILDADANGYISADEATGNQSLSTRWTVLDKDSNNQLDKSEFSAFEIDADTTQGDNNLMRENTQQQGTMPPASPAE